MPKPRLTLAHWSLVGLALLCVPLGVRYANKAADDRSAFVRWRSQLLQLDEKDISREFAYPNPPVMAVLLEPFALLPPMLGALTWFALKAVMALASLYWAWKLVEDRDAPFPPWAAALAVLLALKPILDDLQHGNVNLFILFLVMASLEAFRRKWDLSAGVLLALAISCKVTPALFVPYFVWKRQWRLLAGCGVGMALFLYPGLVPALRLGWDDNQTQLISWYEVMVRPFVVEGKVTSEHINQSLPGLLFRLVTDSPSFTVFVNDVETPARYDNVLSLPLGAVKWLVKGCMAAFALGFVGLARTPNDARRGWRLAAELGAVMLGMLLFSERTWKHHSVVLVLPFAVLCYRLATAEARSRSWWCLAGTLAATACLMLVAGVGGGKERAEAAVSPGLAKLALVYGCYTWAFVLMLAALAAQLYAGRGAAAVVAEVTPARAA